MPVPLALLLALADPAPGGGSGWHFEQRRGSCSIEAATDRGSYVKLEHDPLRNIHYLTVSSPAWPQVVDRGRYRVGIVTDGRPRVEVAAVGVKDDGGPRSLLLLTLPRPFTHPTRPRFTDDFRRAKTIRLDLDGVALQLDTTGLRAASERMYACSSAIQQQVRQPKGRML